MGILEECQKLGLEKEKVIDYWNSNKKYEFLDMNFKKISELEKNNKMDRRLKNISYELEIKSVPQIRPDKELLEIIINDKKSLSRFGAGDYGRQFHRAFQNELNLSGFIDNDEKTRKYNRKPYVLLIK